MHLTERILEVPQFCPLLNKSRKHFGQSFAFDAPTTWNGLADDVCSAPSVASRVFYAQNMTWIFLNI